MHLVVEASNNIILSKGMRSLTITFAKRINGIYQREGKVQKERFHLHILRTLREVKNAVKYVLHNHERHTNIKTKDLYTSINSLDFPLSWLLCEVIKKKEFG